MLSKVSHKKLKQTGQTEIKWRSKAQRVTRDSLASRKFQIMGRSNIVNVSSCAPRASVVNVPASNRIQITSTGVEAESSIMLQFREIQAQKGNW